MNLAPPASAHPTPPPTTSAFNAEQKEYLAGFLASLALRQALEAGRDRTASPGAPLPSDDPKPTPPAETIYGHPLDEVTRQERWKHAEHGLDSWHRIAAHAATGSFPDEENTFRFRFHGLFFVGPTQQSFMLRCRIPAGELSTPQLAGLAAIADDYGNGQAALTTRSNVQIREIAPNHLTAVLRRLTSLGLTSRGSGVDNVRNITASPTAGFDPQELLDTRPFAHALHEFILHHRDLYNLPRKFNVAFEGGGAIETVADTNDIGFLAVRIPAPGQTPITPARAVADDQPHPVPAGVAFRVALAGITGHKQLARDAGILVAPAQAVAVAAAMIRVFVEYGDRTDRKKARLKYLLENRGVDWFLAQTQARLPFPLLRFPLEHCETPPPPVKHAHLGVHLQSQPGRRYIGVLVPVGMLTSRQMRGIAALAQNYAGGEVRLTPWQNLLIPHVPEGFVATVTRQLQRLGLGHTASHIAGGLVACTGNRGCKYAATDTKGDALQLAKHLGTRIQLDQPVNIHFTGCPHSCAQHYVGDIGLQGVKIGAENAEGYQVVFGGGTGPDAGIAREVFKAVPAAEVPALLERVFNHYLARRQPQESFLAFVRRQDVAALKSLAHP